MAPALIAKCFMGLGASHYVFLKEIPLGSQYTIESRFAGWGQKWLYLVSEFIIYPKSSGKGKVAGAAQSGDTAEVTVPDAKAGVTSPLLCAAPAPPSAAGEPTLESVQKAATSLRNREPRSDGGITCCIAVTEYCVKAGRLTVPPVCLRHLIEVFILTSPANRSPLCHALS